MMKYEILDKAELDAGVEFYQAYFYGNGERSLLLKHLETWPSHANWLVAEILFFLKNHDQDSRWPNGGIGYDIRDDQIWMYFTTGIDENNNNTNKNIEYIIKTPKKSVIPRSEKQKNYVRALKGSDIVISAGPAGTGKTFLAVAVGLTMLLEKKIERIILSRPAVEAGERLGFLPGDMREKVDPYLRPLYDSLYDLLDFEKIQKKIEIGDIEIAPLAFMRGRTLKNSFAILDEAQNATDTQIKMFLTRIGENSKIVINGDPSQIDLPNKNLSGLNRSKKILGNLSEISIIDFDHSDVVRHPLVSKIVKAYSDIKND